MATLNQSIRLVKHLFEKNAPVPYSVDMNFEEFSYKLVCWVGKLPSEILGGKLAIIVQFSVGILGDRILIKIFPSNIEAMGEFSSLKRWFVDISASAKEFDYLYDNYLQFDVDELEGND